MWRGGEPRSVRRVAAAAMEANPVAGEDSAGAEVALTSKTDPTMMVVMATVPEVR